MNRIPPGIARVREVMPALSRRAVEGFARVRQTIPKTGAAANRIHDPSGVAESRRGAG